MAPEQLGDGVGVEVVDSLQFALNPNEKGLNASENIERSRKLIFTHWYWLNSPSLSLHLELDFFNDFLTYLKLFLITNHCTAVSRRLQLLLLSRIAISGICALPRIQQWSQVTLISSRLTQSQQTLTARYVRKLAWNDEILWTWVWYLLTVGL